MINAIWILFLIVVFIFVFLSNPDGCLGRVLVFVLIIITFVTPFWPFILILGFLWLATKNFFDKH